MNELERYGTLLKATKDMERIGYHNWSFLLFIHWLINSDIDEGISQKVLNSDMFKWISENGGWSKYYK